jgi:MarR-like DNA-binding transcriptional regulator SgrR of sgrS sRNA
MQNLNDYLNNNISNTREVSNTASFYDKFHKLSSYYDTININKKLLRAQGKYNSKICFLFKNEEHFKTCHDSLQRIMDVYDIKIWDVVILYSDKTDNESQNIDIILNELSIINPIVLYIYDNAEINNKIMQASINKIVLSCRMINVNNVQSAVEQNLSAQIFDLFEYLITYNY